MNQDAVLRVIDNRWQEQRDRKEPASTNLTYPVRTLKSCTGHHGRGRGKEQEIKERQLRCRHDEKEERKKRKKKER